MKKVIVALSGGVDSAVCALLLKKQGYLVEAIFMRNWDSSLNFDIKGNPFIQDDCPQEEEFKIACQVALQLDIKLHRVDFIEEYWQKVFSYFIKSFQQNLTPNPDVVCNNEIKFKVFINYVAKNFPHFQVATGHYASLIYDKNNNPMLGVALDQNKDQTYFLSQLKTSQLQNVIFPLGNFTKQEVRQLAANNHLINANKKDSTGICFIGERKFFHFLNNYLPSQPGEMQTLDGTFLKHHQGVMYYTIGQRKNLGLGGTGKNSPWFVVGKSLAKNILYVAQDANHHYLYSNKALITDVVWRGGKKRTQLYVKMRYRQDNQKVSLTWLTESTLEINYPQTIKAVTPGQICAFYYDNICYGAGMIKQVYFDKHKRLYT